MLSVTECRLELGTLYPKPSYTLPIHAEMYCIATFTLLLPRLVVLKRLSVQVSPSDSSCFQCLRMAWEIRQGKESLTGMSKLPTSGSEYEGHLRRIQSVNTTTFSADAAIPSFRTRMLPPVQGPAQSLEQYESSCAEGASTTPRAQRLLPIRPCQSRRAGRDGP